MASADTAEKKIGNKNEKVGQVVSAKMTKTIVVEVTRRVPHPVYKRIINKRSKFYAHDEQRTAQVGDTVRIIECRPDEQAQALAAGGSAPQGRASCGGAHRRGSGNHTIHLRIEIAARQ